MDEAGERSRAWIRARALALATLAYAALLLVLERGFIHDATRFLYDMRTAPFSNLDKINEIESSSDEMINHRLRRLLGAKGYAIDEGSLHLNMLPTFLLWIFKSLLPVVPAYNLLTFLAMIGNCLAGFLLARTLQLDRPAAWVAGALFGCAPTTLDIMATSSLDYVMAFWIPLLLASLLRVRDRGGWPSVVFCGLVLFSLGETNYYFLVAGLFPALGLTALALRGPSALRRSGRMLVALALGLVLLLPLILVELPNITARRALGISPGVDSEHTFAGLGEIFSCWDAGWMLVVALLALVGLFARGEPRSLRTEKLLFAAISLGWTVLIIESMLGHPLTGPLVYSVDLLWRMRSLGSTILMPMLLFTILAAAGMASLGRRTARWRRGWIFAAAAGLVVLGLALGGSGRRGPAREKLRQLHIPSPVLERIAGMPQRGRVLMLDGGDEVNYLRFAGFYLQSWTGRPVLLFEDALVAEVHRALSGGPLPAYLSQYREAGLRGLSGTKREIRSRCDHVVLLRWERRRNGGAAMRRALRELDLVLWQRGAWQVAAPRRCRGGGGPG